MLAGALGVVLGQKNGWKMSDGRKFRISLKPAAPKPDPTPQDAIYAMLDAARCRRRENLPGQLHRPDGSRAASNRIAETTEAGFAKYLKDSNAAIKGIAISEPQTLTDREVKVRVEYVYQDRNEAQTMYLEKGAGGWKIARVDSAERVKTLVPYGTPVQ